MADIKLGYLNKIRDIREENRKLLKIKMEKLKEIKKLKFELENIEQKIKMNNDRIKELRKELKAMM